MTEKVLDSSPGGFSADDPAIDHSAVESKESVGSPARKAANLRSANELSDAGLVPERAREALSRVAQRYAIAVTPTMAGLIDIKDPGDPISRQFIPDVRELDARPQELSDPIGDHPHSPVSGIVHRYRDRVLLKITHVCPVYCRFCFRREMVGPQNGDGLSADELVTALDYIRAHPEVSEVILTGGDPFILSPRRMRGVTEAIGQIGHVAKIRWHTRVPVVDPARVSSNMVAALNASAKRVIVAVHTNHAREFTPAAREAIARLADAGIELLSQSVLLKGINDDADTLEALMRVIVENRIKPYYLHHGDLAPGTSHLRTTIKEGKALMRLLAQRVPVELLPRYVLDIPGGYGKVEIADNVTDLGNGSYTVRDLNGRLRHYEDAT